MSFQMVLSDSEYQCNQNIGTNYTTPLISHHNNQTNINNNINNNNYCYAYPKMEHPPKNTEIKKVNKTSRCSNCLAKTPKILVIILWLISIASLAIIVNLYSQKKRFLLKKMQSLYLMGIIIISLMDVCIALIAILFLCSSFRFKQVLIFTNILKIIGFAMLIFDYEEIEDKIKGQAPNLFLINIYIESSSSLISFILLFYFIFSYFKNN